MYLTRHNTNDGPRWALDGLYLPKGFSLGFLLGLEKTAVFSVLGAMKGEGGGETAVDDPLLPPIEASQEVWASGVTYLRSRQARQAESSVADVYQRVYEAERPELFFKALGWRTAGSGQPLRIRHDSSWNVPEPELTLVINAFGDIVGYCAGNDMSSRSIEGENPLYLPQAKTYRGACGLGPGLWLAPDLPLTQMPIKLEIERGNAAVFAGQTNSDQMKRTPSELVDWLGRELDFPQGVFLLTGTGLVPDESFTLQVGDVVRVRVGELLLENRVEG